jgi:hypothetical protein
LLFSFALEHAIRCVHGNQEVLKLNGTEQLLTNVDDINIEQENTDKIKNTEALLNTSKEVCLEVNPDKSKYMLASRNQKIGQKPRVNIANRWFGDVARFRYLGTTLTDLNCVHEEIKNKTKFGECLLPFDSESFVFPPAV